MNIIHRIIFMKIIDLLNRISRLDILSIHVYVTALVMLMVTIYNGFPLLYLFLFTVIGFRVFLDLVLIFETRSHVALVGLELLM